MSLTFSSTFYTHLFHMKVFYLLRVWLWMNFHTKNARIKCWWNWLQLQVKLFVHLFASFMCEYFFTFLCRTDLWWGSFFTIVSKSWNMVAKLAPSFCIVKIDSITRSFCLCYYLQNGLSYPGKETLPMLC